MADKFKNLKFPNYFKNVVKSVQYTAGDVFKDQVPALISATETNAELVREVANGIKNMDKTIKNIKTDIAKSEVSKDIKDILGNAMDDLRTGKFYNKARQDALREKEFKREMGYDDDIFSDIDFGKSSSRGDSGDIYQTAVTNNIMTGSNNWKREADFQVQLTGSQNATATKNTYITNALNAKMHMQSMRQLGAINENIGKLITLSNDNITPTLRKINSFFDESITEQRRMVALLQESVEIQKLGMGKGASYNTSEEISDNIMIDNIFDIREYGKNIKKNIITEIEENLMDFSMIKSMSGGSPLAEIAASPLSFATRAAVEKMIPQFFKKSLDSLNKVVEGFSSSFLLKMNKLAANDDNPFFAMIGKMLGMEFKSKSVDIGKYEKGQVPFDGVTRKAIVDVIPRLLSKIYSAISNLDDELIVNYDTGSFEWKSDKQKSYKRYKDSAGMDEFRDTLDLIEDRLSVFEFADPRQLEGIREDINSVFKELRDTGILYNPYDKKQHEELSYLTKEQTSMDFLRAAIKSLSHGEIMDIGRQTIQANKSGRAAMRALGEDSSMTGIAQLLMDNATRDGSEKMRENRLKGLTTGSAIDVLERIRRTLVQGIIVYPFYNKPSAGKFPDMDPLLSKQLESRFAEEAKLMKREEKILISKRESERAFQEDIDKREDILGERVAAKGRVMVPGEGLDYLLSGDSEEASNEIAEMLKKNADFVKAQEKRRKQGGKESKPGFFSNLFGKVGKLYQKPFEIMDSVVSGIDNSLFYLIFGKDAKEGDTKKGLFKTFFDTLKEKFDGVFDYLKDQFTKRILDPLRILMLRTVIPSFKNVFGKVGDFLFGKKLDIGGRDGTGLLSNIIDEFKNVFGKVKGALVGAMPGGGIDPSSIVGNIKGMSTDIFNKMSEYIFGTALFDIKDGVKEFTGRAKDGALSGIITGIKDGATSIKDFFFGSLSDKNQELFNKFKDYLPKGIASGTVGSGIGVIASMFLPGGPLLGAIIGGGLGIAKSSGKLDQFLFGREDEDGTFIKGIFDKNLKDEFNITLPKVAGGSAIGMVAGLFLPGGPLLGGLVGGFITMTKESETVRNFLFGKDGVDGLIGKDFQDKWKEHMPKVAKGSALGALVGGVGFGSPFLGAFVGAAASVVKDSGAFRRFLIGDYDPEKNPMGRRGLLPHMQDFIMKEITLPFKNFIDLGKENLNYFFKKNLFNPLTKSLVPIGKEFQRVIKGIGTKVGEVFENSIGIPIRKFLEKGIFNPIKKVLGGVLSGAGKLLKLIFFPIKIIESVSEGLARKHQRLGVGDYVSGWKKKWKDVDSELEESHIEKLGKISPRVAERKRKMAEAGERIDMDYERDKDYLRRRKAFKKELKKDTAEDKAFKAEKASIDAEHRRPWSRPESDEQKDERFEAWNRRKKDLFRRWVKYTKQKTYDLMAKYDISPNEPLGKDIIADIKKVAKSFDLKRLSRLKGRGSKKISPIQAPSDTPSMISADEALVESTELATDLVKTTQIVPTSQTAMTSSNLSEIIPGRKIPGAIGGKGTGETVEEYNERIASSKQSKYSAKDPVVQMSNDVKTIRKEIFGQIDGVGYNVAKIYDILRSYTGLSADEEVKGTKSKKRKGFFGRTFNKITAPFEGLVNKIKEPFINMKEKVKEVVDTVAEPFRRLGDIIGSITISFEKLWKIGSFISKGVGKAVKGVGGLVSFMWEGLKDGVGILLAGLRGAAEGVMEFGKTIWQAAGILFPALGSLVKGVVGGTWELGKTVGRTAWSGVKKVTGKLAGRQSLIGKAWNKVKSWGVGKKIGGFASGVKSKAGKLFDWAKGKTVALSDKARDISSGIRDALSSDVIKVEVVGGKLDLVKLVRKVKSVATSDSLIPDMDDLSDTTSNISGRISRGKTAIQMTAEKAKNKTLTTLNNIKTEISSGNKNTKGLLGFTTKISKSFSAMIPILLGFFTLVKGKLAAIPTLLESIPSLLKDLGSAGSLAGAGALAKAGGLYKGIGKVGALSAGFGLGKDILTDNFTLEGFISGTDGQTTLADIGDATLHAGGIFNKRANALVTKVSGSKAFGNMARTGKKLASTATKTVGTQVKDLLGKILKDEKVAKLLGGADNTKKIFNTVAKKLTGSAMAKVGGRILARFAGPVGIAMIVNDLITGFTDTKRILGLPPDSSPTLGMRLAASAGKTLSGFTFGLVPQAWLTENIYKALGGDKNTLDALQNEMSAQAEKAGMSVDDYNASVNKGAWERIFGVFGFGKKKKLSDQPDILGAGEGDGNIPEIASTPSSIGSYIKKGLSASLKYSPLGIAKTVATKIINFNAGILGRMGSEVTKHFQTSNMTGLSPDTQFILRELMGVQGLLIKGLGIDIGGSGKIIPPGGLTPENVAEYSTSSSVGSSSFIDKVKSKFSSWFGSGGDIPGMGGDLPLEANSLAYFNQKDPLWSSKAYATEGKPDKTIGSSGCGPTAASMAISSLLGQTISPSDSAEYSLSKGFRQEEGTAHGFFKSIGETMGINVEEKTINRSNRNQIDKALKERKPVITVGLGSAPYTSGGHFITLAGGSYADGYKVNDPLNADNNMVFSGKDLLDKTQKAWILSKDGMGVTDESHSQYLESRMSGNLTHIPIDSDGTTTQGSSSGGIAGAFSNILSEIGNLFSGMLGGNRSGTSSSYNGSSVNPSGDQKSFLRMVLPGAIASYKKYGVLPSLTISQAILESNWGKSSIGNNLFGIKAGSGWTGKTKRVPTTEYENGKLVKTYATFRDYDSISDSIEDHARLLASNSRYAKVISTSDYREANRLIREAGYATDPEYTNKLNSITEQYKLHMFNQKGKTADELALEYGLTPAGGDSALFSGNYGITAAYRIPGKWSAGYHTGVDFGTPAGTPLYTPVDGTVTYAGDTGSGYGNLVKIKDKQGYTHLFGHLSNIGAKVGSVLKAGQSIGLSGGVVGAVGSGTTTGPHLHYEVRDADQYKGDVDPSPWYSGNKNLTFSEVSSYDSTSKPSWNLKEPLTNLSKLMNYGSEVDIGFKPFAFGAGGEAPSVESIEASLNDYHKDISSRIQDMLNADYVGSTPSGKSIGFSKIIELLEEIRDANKKTAENTEAIAIESAKSTALLAELENNTSETSNNNNIRAEIDNVSSNNIFLGRMEENRRKVNDMVRNKARRVALGH